MKQIVRDTVKVEIPLVCAAQDQSPFQFAGSIFDTEYIRHLIQSGSLYGEVFIETVNYRDINDLATIHLDNTAFRITNIAIDLSGNVTATVEWFALDKLHVLRTYGDLHYIVRGFYDSKTPNYAKVVTVDCVSKKSSPTT
ncbi:MAG: hypothetical protein NC489_08335 [Ruminococcus flavefaciens]|nr:hypothetical protein [Ruminococcus flavefaciens]